MTPGAAWASATRGGLLPQDKERIVRELVDPRRLVDAIRIGRRTMRGARQSIRAGLELSAVAMVAAALGHVPPTVGAALQEGIDVAVILDALRASR